MGKILLMKLLWTILLLTTLAPCRVFPDAPDTIPLPQKKCGPWSCWDYATHHISNKEVFKRKVFWGTFTGDVLFGSFDAEMTHEGLAHHRCVEHNINPPYPSRWQLYRANIPENAATGVASFLLTKLKAPKWLTPMILTPAAVAHLRGGIGWYENCW
jgi:hypothetical protein